MIRWCGMGIDKVHGVYSKILDVWVQGQEEEEDRGGGDPIGCHV